MSSSPPTTTLNSEHTPPTKEHQPHPISIQDSMNQQEELISNLSPIPQNMQSETASAATTTTPTTTEQVTGQTGIKQQQTATQPSLSQGQNGSALTGDQSDKQDQQRQESLTFMTLIDGEGSSSNITNPQSNEEKVTQLQSELSNLIEDLEVRVDSVIERHEAEFLLAYRGHMVSMKEEMNKLKQRAAEHEKRINDSDRMTALETEVTNLKTECAGLYKIISEKREEIRLKDSAIKEALRDNALLEDQIKELMKKNKLMQFSILSPKPYLKYDNISASDSKKPLNSSSSPFSKQDEINESNKLSVSQKHIFQSIQEGSPSPAAAIRSSSRILSIKQGGFVKLKSSTLQSSPSSSGNYGNKSSALGEFMLSAKQINALEQANPDYGQTIINIVRRCLTGESLEMNLACLVTEMAKLCKDISDRGSKLFKQTKEKLDRTIKEKLKASLMRSELETFFLECIESAKKSLSINSKRGGGQSFHLSPPPNHNGVQNGAAAASATISGILNGNSGQSPMKNRNHDFSPSIPSSNRDEYEVLKFSNDFRLFRNEDKLKILELLLSHEKLLIFIHEKIFPNSVTSAVRDHLVNNSQHNQSIHQQQQQLQQQQQQQQSLQNKSVHQSLKTSPALGEELNLLLEEYSDKKMPQNVVASTTSMNESKFYQPDTLLNSYNSTRKNQQQQYQLSQSGVIRATRVNSVNIPSTTTTNGSKLPSILRENLPAPNSERKRESSNQQQSFEISPYELIAESYKSGSFETARSSSYLSSIEKSNRSKEEKRFTSQLKPEIKSFDSNHKYKPSIQQTTTPFSITSKSMNQIQLDTLRDLAKPYDIKPELANSNIKRRL